MGLARQVGGVVHAIRTLQGELPFDPPAPTVTEPYAPPASGVARLADVYLPAQPNGASMVLVHGGGFLFGSRDMKPMRLLARDLVGAGVAVCSLDYRVLRHARLPGMVEDVTRGLEWWLDRAGSYRLDPERVSVLGQSAGGTLALLANERLDGTYRAVVSIFGLYDFDAVHGAVVRAIRRGLVPGRDRSAWSPRTACASETPLYLFHGTDDALVPVAQARAFAAERRASGKAVHLRVFEGAPHAYVSQIESPASVETRRAVVAIALA